MGSLTPNILAEMPADDSFRSDRHLAVPKVSRVRVRVRVRVRELRGGLAVPKVTDGF